MYVSLMAAFFWLNSLGYYIWKTFRYVCLFSARANHLFQYTF